MRRIHGDKSYRGHNYPDRFRVWISGSVRRVTKPSAAKCAAVEPVIGHLKDDHWMRRNYLKGRDGDRINAVLATAGYMCGRPRRCKKNLVDGTACDRVLTCVRPLKRLSTCRGPV